MDIEDAPAPAETVPAREPWSRPTVTVLSMTDVQSAIGSSTDGNSSSDLPP